MGKSRGRVLIGLKQLFLVKPVKWYKYYRKQLWYSKGPHTAKRSFSGVLKHFRWKLTKKTSLKVKKVKLRFTNKVIFS